MRKRLKFSYFLVFLVFIMVALIGPLLFNAKGTSASQEMPVPYTERQFIQLVAKEVKPLAKNYGIRPSILIGQIILETNYGRTLLAAKYHNLFSLQPAPGQASISLKKQATSKHKTAYAIYRDREDSIRAYLSWLSQGTGEEKKLYQSLATEKGYKKPAKSLQTYRYSDDKGYAQRLVQLIEVRGLTSYDD
ncbi:glucosaminidase domain-containing protein [Streptococcus equi subsp. zooepidemicus]|uniref:glucosaminidase domain-containing protein n=1 Tax=Streptococcus equi TaxID=1336 RepID=UPI0010CAB52F|nr:glucosaminidase domain-containing protein [Streptococcus equi]MCD3412219.1 glucosaminidase domain-containing protein [Streptococcus equi subsp. zooepidemicus]MCD3454221.1 glucosaminidase domain-containing protein [Streptococcus equi subsp. zooepidemicus]MDI6075637.1 glucosaminidase domain-containing protein [Streptococcus equi subsp. zooepidemicus]VTS15991.1 N-acetyl-muramidase [Streptococcus equi subsp. zooepidemicus]HEL0648696.1 glucosaminidase domain-containing protein [Streptococcus equ